MSDLLVVVAGLILNAKGEALMTLRYPHKLRPNMWEYPGGKVDPGETEKSALRRELYEELGVDVLVRDLIGAVELTMEVPFLWKLWVCTLPLTIEPRPLEAAALMYVDPLAAIQRLPCTPTTYLIYPHLRDYVANTRCV